MAYFDYLDLGNRSCLPGRFILSSLSILFRKLISKIDLAQHKDCHGDDQGERSSVSSFKTETALLESAASPVHLLFDFIKVIKSVGWKPTDPVLEERMVTGPLVSN